jgi:ABC-type Zn uptake system ZnuABC Zn-binding protein ZnuA
VRWLTDPFAPAYMQRALVETGLLAIAAGALGAFVTLRRLAFATHALGVGTFPGAVVAFWLGGSAFFGGLVASLAIAGAILLLSRRRDLDLPVATGLVLAGALALGSLLVSDVVGPDPRVDGLLFGSLLGVSGSDVVRSAIVVGIAVLALGAVGRGWLATAFDRDGASAAGLAPGRLDVVLLATLTVVVVATVDVVGSLLVSALLVVPAATARLWARRLPQLLATSALLAFAASGGGLVVSYHLDAPPGATIAALSVGAFLVATAAVSARGRLRRLAALGALAGSVLVAAACSGAESPTRASTVSQAAAARLAVVATTPLVADWAREVGGDAIGVTQILQPNVDAHDFEPSTQDADAVASAAVVLSSGAGLDGWADGLVESAGGERVLVEVAPEERLKPPALAGDDAGGADGHGGADPHFWHDPTLVIEAVRTIAAALARADPAGAAAFAANADRYVAELEALDAELAAQFGAVPAGRRRMVTDHDAFGYLADRYGIAVVGAAIPSASTAAEPSAAAIAALIETIEREAVPTVFAESSVDPKLLEQIAREAGAVVAPDLYGDTLGPAGSGAATYVEMMRHNAQVLVDGFTQA